ncbi:YveK family protein [Cohnella soli]|uniref:YveK family protein n=1 Tax=Cohnella soli TaxID=425005 RepID=A0ABW0HWS9_9BACL
MELRDAGEPQEPELKQYVKLLWKRMWLIGLMMLMFGGAVFVQHSLYSSPRYEATAKIIVSTTKTAAEAVRGVDASQIASDIMLIDTYKEILTTPDIMEEVVEKHPEFGLTAEQIGKKLKVSSSEKSQVMSLAIEDASAPRAVAIVNAVTEVFRQEIPKILNVDNVSLLSEAKMSDQTPNLSLSLTKKLVIAFLFAIVVSVAIVFLWEYWDDKVREEKDVLSYLGKPMLARVGKIKPSELRMVDDANSKNMAGDSVHVGVNQ